MTNNQLFIDQITGFYNQFQGEELKPDKTDKPANYPLNQWGSRKGWNQGRKPLLRGIRSPRRDIKGVFEGRKGRE